DFASFATLSANGGCRIAARTVPLWSGDRGERFPDDASTLPCRATLSVNGIGKSLEAKTAPTLNQSASTLSAHLPTAITVASAPGRPTSCSDTGNPLLSVPQGMLSAGIPEELNGPERRVTAPGSGLLRPPNSIVVSPCFGMDNGIVGNANTSASFSAAIMLSRIWRRSRCALT